MIKTFVSGFVLCAVALGTAACSTVSDSMSDKKPAIASPSLSAMQFIGTHNSYHIEPPRELFDLMIETNYAESAKWPASKLVAALAFSHPPISKQLDLGLRVLEFDLHDDPEGGRFSNPGAYELLTSRGLIQKIDFDPEGKLKQPGFKVFHTVDTDVQSRCLLFADCLKEIRQWSARNPNHLPIFVQLETKESRKPPVLDAYTSASPSPFTSSSWTRLHQEIFDIFSPETILRPDDVRGSHQSVNAAIRSQGWPRLEDARGKIVFLLLDEETKQREYIKFARSNSAEMVLFPSLEAHNPHTAWLMRPNPKSKDIRRRVSEGFLVYTRADKHTTQARTNDYTRRDKALFSGAQIVATDFPVPDSRYSSYQVKINGQYVGCNGIYQRAECLSYNLGSP